MLQKLDFASVALSHLEERATLGALIATFDVSAPLHLGAHRTSDSKLRFLQAAVVGMQWSLMVSFRLLVTHSYMQLLYD